MAVREKELKTAGVVVGDEIHNSINNLQDSAARLPAPKTTTAIQTSSASSPFPPGRGSHLLDHSAFAYHSKEVAFRVQEIIIHILCAGRP